MKHESGKFHHTIESSLIGGGGQINMLSSFVDSEI